MVNNRNFGGFIGSVDSQGVTTIEIRANWIGKYFWRLRSASSFFTPLGYLETL
jgi:hypothetical protein